MINSDTFEKKLGDLRQAIDTIDNKIVSMINERLEISLAVGRLKEEFGMQVLDRSRESLIMQKIAGMNQGPVSDTVLQYIYSVIMAESRELQKPLSIAYLGPEATYTHTAALNHFKYAGKFIPQKNIREIFAEVERGACQYGVVPVENSIEGAVNHTLDLLFEMDVKIVGEKYQTISHDLMSETGRLEDIQIVYSHPQPFAQCRNWIQGHLPNAILEECSSTAQAAQKAMGDKKAAAIAGTKASQVYNLKIVESRIEDSTKNETRFLIIGKEDMEPTGKDKTSIMFVTSHVPGALFKTLEPVAKAGLNMVKLESRPTKSENWSYFFIMDLEGHVKEKKINDILTVMKHLSLFSKVCGSYPVDDRKDWIEQQLQQTSAGESSDEK